MATLIERIADPQPNVVSMRHGKKYWNLESAYFFLAESDWEPFDWAAQKIRAKLGTSDGVSARMLRELCVSGDERAMLLTHSGDGDSEPVRRIKPSEWRTTELDIEDDLGPSEGAADWVEVSLDDLEYWLERQEPDAEPKPKDKKNEAIVKRLKEGIVPGSTMPWKTWDDLIAVIGRGEDFAAMLELARTRSAEVIENRAKVIEPPEAQGTPLNAPFSRLRRY
jgi:hypothetical protein